MVMLKRMNEEKKSKEFLERRPPGKNRWVVPGRDGLKVLMNRGQP